MANCVITSQIGSAQLFARQHWHTFGPQATIIGVEDVPIPTVRPDIGPIEACAKCKGLVDMAAFLLTYTECETRENGDGTATPLDLDYLAVVCNGCSRGCGTDEAATRAPAELQVERSNASSPNSSSSD